MTQDKIHRKKKNRTEIFPSNGRCGKYDEGDGRTMTELHMATIQALLRGDGFEMQWFDRRGK